MDASIDLNWVRAFVQVVESGSFTAAARPLGMPKSSVSRTIAKLESELGIRLIQRTTRHLHLTEAGRAYFERTRPALSEMLDAGRDTIDLRQTPRGLVRVTVPADFGSDVVGQIFAAFQERYPEVILDFVVTNRQVDLVREGVDLAIRGVSSMNDSTLVARKVMHTILGLYASPAYLHGKPAINRPADLTQHRCIVLRAASGSLPWIFNGPRGAERFDIEGSIFADDMGFCRQLMLAGLGVGMSTELGVLPHLSAGTLVRVLPRYRFSDSNLYVVTPSLKNVPARVAVLRDFLIAELARRLPK